MTPEIKERIERLRRGETPDGYKRSNVGIMPGDWHEESVGNCAREYKKLSNDIAAIPVYSSSRKGLMPQSEYYDQKEAAETNLGYKVVPQGYATYRHMSDDDIFHFNVNKTNGEILVSSEYPVFTASENCDLGFLIPALNEMTRFRYFCRTQKLGGTRTRLYFHNLVQYRLGLPTLAEQRKIADVLSAQDKIIELKKRLLTEKERQKKWLMQRLLTGKQRPPGFSGEWKTLKAGEIFRNVSDKNHNGDLEVLSATQDRGIIPRSQLDIDIKYDNAALPNYKRVRQGNFVISLRSFQGGIEYSAYEGLVSPAYTVLENKIPVDCAYYKQYFKSPRYIAQLQTAVYGIRDGKQISYEDFGFIGICYPPVDEQKAIGEILTAADREIDLLRRGLEEEQRMKKALSQLLLTGIVRF